MPEWLTELWEAVLPHAWGIGYVLGFAFVGEVMKRRVLNPKNVRILADARDRLWNAGGWKRAPGALLKIFISIPLPFHPLTAAVLLGCFSVSISDGINPTFWNRVIYVGVLGGVVSQGFYSIVHSLLRNRGLDFRLPGEMKDPKPVRRRYDGRLPNTLIEPDPPAPDPPPDPDEKRGFP